MSHLDEGFFHAVLDGEVPSAELATMERHLKECPVCRATFEEARKFHAEAATMVEALDLVPVSAAPISQHRAPRRRIRWAVGLAWAATLVAAVGLGYQMGGVRSSPADLAVNLSGQVDQVAAGADTALDARYRNLVRAESDQKTPLPAAKIAAVRPVSAPSSSEPAAPSAGLADDRRPAPLAASENRTTDSAESKEAGNVVADPSKDELEESSRTRGAPPARSPGRRAAPAPVSERGGNATGLSKDLLRLDQPAPANPADQRRREISAVSAIAALGGSIRLVDGFTPSRFEQQGEVIRVVYRTPLGPMVLEQWRAGELLAHELIPPPGAPADSIHAWEKRIR